MTSIEMAPHENGIHESLDSSEFSLIPEHPFDGEEHQKEMTNSQYDMGSDFPIQDLSTVEIQKHLVELVEDNESMKKALKYNNELMEEQLHTISEWHKQMTTSLSQQRTSLVEAHLKIEELEKEKAELLQKVASISQHENTPSIDNEIDFEIIQAKKEEEVVEEQINERENKVSNQFQPSVDKQNAEIEESLKVQIKETQSRVSELQLLVDRQNAEINNLRALCEMKEEENINMKVQLRDHNELKSRYESLVLEKKSHQRSAITEEQLKLLLQEADKQYAQEQIALQKERINHAETKKLLMDLQEKYNRVDKLLQIQSKDQKQKDEQLLSERVQDTKRALEQIDGLTAKLFDLEQQLEDRNETVRKLSEQLEAVRQESESIPILKAQLDVYKADLSNDKEAAQKEIERLSQELGDLQTAVSFCSSCGAGNAHADTAARAKGRRRQGSSHQDFTSFLCPLCNIGFKDVKALENHVNGCLDKAQ